MTAPVSALTLAAAAVALGVLGWLIRFQRRVYLVAGVEPNDTDAMGAARVASLVGGLVLFVGVLTAGLAAAVAVDWWTPTLWGGYTLAVVSSVASVSVLSRAGRRSVRAGEECPES